VERGCERQVNSLRCTQWVIYLLNHFLLSLRKRRSYRGGGGNKMGQCESCVMESLGVFVMQQRCVIGLFGVNIISVMTSCYPKLLCNSPPCWWWSVSVKWPTAPGCWWWTPRRMNTSAAVAWHAPRTWLSRWERCPRALRPGPLLRPRPYPERTHPWHPNPTTHTPFALRLQLTRPQTRPQHKPRWREPQWHPVQRQTQR